MTEYDPVEVEAPIPPTFAALQAEIARWKHEAAALEETLRDMDLQRHTGRLPRERYTDFMYYDDHLRVRRRRLDRLDPYLTFAKEEDRMTRGKGHHDTLCGDVSETTLLLCRSYNSCVETGQRLRQLIDTQIDPLTLLVKPDGHTPAFELDPGSATLTNMLNALPPLTRLTPLNEGQIAAICDYAKARCEPFTDTNVQRYLALYAVPQEKPDVPVEEVQHASND